MTVLVRFHNWIIDKEQINLVEIKCLDGKASHDYEKKLHAVVVHMKNGKNFQLNVDDMYEAKKQLDILTANLNPQIVGRPFDSYIVQQIYIARKHISDLTDTVNKLMNSYKKGKKMSEQEVKLTDEQLLRIALSRLRDLERPLESISNCLILCIENILESINGTN